MEGHNDASYGLSGDEDCERTEGDGLAFVAQSAIDDVAAGVSSVKRAVKGVDAHVKESGRKSSHPWTRRLGSYSGKNPSRDFWRFCSIPVESQRLTVQLKSKKPEGV